MRPIWILAVALNILSFSSLAWSEEIPPTQWAPEIRKARVIGAIQKIHIEHAENGNISFRSERVCRFEGLASVFDLRPGFRAYRFTKVASCETESKGTQVKLTVNSAVTYGQHLDDDGKIDGDMKSFMLSLNAENATDMKAIQPNLNSYSATRDLNARSSIIYLSPDFWSLQSDELFSINAEIVDDQQ